MLDRLDMAGGDLALSLAPSVRRKPQAALTGELSPRRAYQRQELRALLAERAAREASLAARAEQRARAEALDRIPQPKPLALPPGRPRTWNPSPVLLSKNRFEYTGEKHET
jgi:hypothetical protein